MSSQSKFLRQKSLIKKADTRSIFDKAKEEGIPFEQAFDQAVKKSQYYRIPEEMKWKNITSERIKSIFRKVSQYLWSK